MTKRMLWYVCVGMICCLALTFIVQAAGNPSNGSNPSMMTKPDPVAKELTPAQKAELAKQLAVPTDLTQPYQATLPTSEGAVAPVQSVTVDLNYEATKAAQMEEVESLKAEISATLEMSKAARDANDNARLNSLKGRLEQLSSRYDALMGRSGSREGSLDQGGETWAAATVISAFPYTDTGTLGSVDDCVGMPYNDVFYVFTATVAGAYTIDMCDATGPYYDMYLKWYKNPTAACTATTTGTGDDECSNGRPNTAVTCAVGDVIYIECGMYSSTATPPTYILNVGAPATYPAGGDNCGNAIAISGAGVHQNTTCGKGHDYDADATCLGSYDTGEDIFYAWTVTQANASYSFSLTTNSSWVGMAVSATCPLTSTCIAYATSSGSSVTIPATAFAPGTYYIQIDQWTSPDCIPAFTLTINEFMNLRACNVMTPVDASLDPFPTGEWAGSVAGNCGNGGKWVGSFTTVAGQAYHFDLCPDAPGTGTADFDIDIKIVDAANAILAGEDGSCTALSYRPNNFTWTAPSAGTYYVVLAPYSSYASHTCLGTSTNTFTMQYYTVACPSAPANDLCANAIPITVNGPQICATTECAALDCPTVPYPEIWYTFTTTGFNDVIVEYCGTVTSGGLATNLFSGSCCGTNVPYTNYEWTTCADGLISIHFNSLPAGTYYLPVAFSPAGAFCVQVVSTASATGRCCYGSPVQCAVNYQSECAALGGMWTTGLTCADACPQPGGEDCATATVITSLPYTGAGSTTGHVNDYTYNTNTAPDVVYSYTPASDIVVNMSLCGSSFDTYLYYYDATCTGTQLGFNDDFCGLQSELDIQTLLAGHTYYIIVDGYMANSGNYVFNLYEYIPPTGRCCYGSPVQCAVNTQAQCTALTGTWVQDANCSTPCPPPPVDPSCMNGSSISQLPAATSANTSEYNFVGNNYIVAEDYTVTTPIAQIRFWGIQAAYSGGWVACAEDPVVFKIRFCPDAAGLPDTLNVAAEYDVSLYAQPTTLVWGGAFGNVVQWEYTLPTPCTLLNGWLAIQGRGDPNCGWLWVQSPTGNANAKQWQNTSWVALAANMSVCMATVCDAPTGVTVYRQTANGNGVNVRFHAPTLGTYDIYRTIEKNNDGNPNGGADPQWTLAGTVIAAAAGDYSFADNSLLTYANYVVVTRECTPPPPTGRCCYGDPLAPSCVTNIQTACAALTGTWTIGLNCVDNPCVGCADFTMTGPGTVSGNTCGAGNNCTVRASEEQIVAVTITTAGNYSFDICSAGESWDSYMYVDATCCATTHLAYDDDACPADMRSMISSVALTPGVYYVNIEGFSTGAGYCGAWTLTVTAL